jgi:hypothetical protein
LWAATGRRGYSGDVTQTLITVLPYLIGATLVAVVMTLFSGLTSMSKGGDFNRRHGNRLMRLRVALQALAVLLFVVYMLLTRL